MKKRLLFLCIAAVFLSAFSMEIRAAGEVISYTELDYSTQIELGTNVTGQLNPQSPQIETFGYATGYTLTMTEGKSYRINFEGHYYNFFILTDGELTGDYYWDLVRSGGADYSEMYFTPYHTGNYRVVVAVPDFGEDSSVDYSITVEETNEIVDYTELDYSTQLEPGTTVTGELNDQSPVVGGLNYSSANYAAGYALTMTEGKSYRINLTSSQESTYGFIAFHILTDGELTGDYGSDCVGYGYDGGYFTPDHTGNYRVVVANSFIYENGIDYSVTVEEINKIIDYTEFDYSTQIGLGTTVTGGLNDQSPVIGNLDFSAARYADGYTLTMTEGKSYRINLTSSKKDTDESITFYILTDGELTGDYGSVYIATRYCNSNIEKWYFTPDHTGNYRIVVANGTTQMEENGAINYSIKVEEVDKIEHYKEITLPFATDTIFDGNKTYDGSYGWKLTFDEPTTFRVSGDYVVYLYDANNPSGGSIDYDGYIYNTDTRVWHIEAGVYLVKFYTCDGCRLQVSMDGGPTGVPAVVVDLPYMDNTIPSVKCYGDDGKSYYRWMVLAQEGKLINYEVTADGEVMQSNHGMPVDISDAYTISVPAEDYTSFAISITEAVEVSYTKMTLEDYLGSISETTDITKPVSGKLDATSVMVSGLYDWYDEAPVQAYRFEVESDYTVLQLKNFVTDSQLQKDIQLWIYKKDETGTYSLVGYTPNDRNPRFDLDSKKSEYYLIVSSGFNPQSMGNFSVEMEVITVPETTHAYVYANAVTLEQQDFFSGKIDLQTPIITDEGFFKNCRAKAYRFDFSALPASSAADIEISRDYASRIFFVKKEATGEYTVLKSSDNAKDRFIATEAAEYYLMVYSYGISYDFEYNYRVSTSIYSHTNIEDILKSVTTTTDCNTTITGSIDENTTHCGNVFGYKGHVVAYKFNIPEAENGDYVLSFRNMQMSNTYSYGNWMYTIAWFDPESGDLYRYTPNEVNGRNMSYLGLSNECYFVLFETNEVFGDYSIDVDLKEMLRPNDSQNIMTIEELLSKTTAENTLPLNIEARPIDQHVVAGDGSFGESGTNYFVDAVKLKFDHTTEINYTFTGAYVNTKMYIYSYEEVSGSYTLLYAFGEGYSGGVSDTRTFDAGTYCFVAADGNNFNLNSYSLKISSTSTIPTLEQRMLEVETVQSIPSIMEGYVGTGDEDNRTYCNGNVIVADIYRFDLKEGDVINISNDGDCPEMFYFYSEELQNFDEISLNFGDNSIARSGSYYLVFYTTYVGLDYYYHYKQVVDVPVRQQKIVGINANLKTITADISDSDLAIQIALSAQVELTATTERNFAFELPHSATDWVISQDRTYATYTVDTDKFNLADNVDKEVKVLINPTMITVTATAGENGTITPAGEFSVAKGADQAFYIEADYDFVIDEIRVNGTVEKTGLEGHGYATYTLSAIEDVTTLEVTFIREVFKPVETYKVTVSTNNEEFGTVIISGDAPDNTGRYINGAKITLTAVPNENCLFIKWSDGDTNATRELTVTEDATFEAIFASTVEPATPVITVDNAEVTVDGTFYADDDVEAKFTVKATDLKGDITFEAAGVTFTPATIAKDNADLATGVEVTAAFKAAATKGENTVTITVKSEGAESKAVTVKYTVKETVEPATPVITIDNAEITVDGTFYADDDVEANFTVKATDLKGDITFEAAGVTFTPATIAKDNADLATGVEVTAAFKAAATKGENTVTITVKSEGAESKAVTVKYTVKETVEPATPVITIDNAEITVAGEFESGADVEAKFTVKAAYLTNDITFEAAGVTFTPATIAKDNADLATGVEVTAAFKAAATKGENTVTITVKSEGAESKAVTVKYTVTEETGVEDVTVVSTVWSESGMLFIEAAAETQATVYTLQGQKVETLNLTQGVNAVALPSATYIVKVGETAVKVSVR